MDIKDYQLQTYSNIQPHNDNKDEVLNWCIGLSEELGECFKHIKHHYWPGKELNKIEISLELGDILWYLSALCSALNLNLDTIATINLEKLNHRFSNGFSKQNSDNRHKLENKFEQTDIFKNLINNIEL